MGMTHFHALNRVRGARVTAICTRDVKKRAGDWRGLGGNFGPRGGREDLSKVRTFEQIEDLLNDETVDLVDICLPTPLHAPVAQAALRAGKHVLVEKPIALTPADARSMLTIATRARRHLMVAHVLPFEPEYAFALRAIVEGRYGPLVAARFKRIICPPAWWGPEQFAASGGPALDLHIHDVHFIVLACGRPKRVRSGGVVRDGIVHHIDTHYDFGDDGPNISCAGGALAQPGRPFTHGFELFFDEATLLYEHATLGGKSVPVMPLTVLTDQGRVRRPKIHNTDPVVGFRDEFRGAVEGVRTGHVPEALSGRAASDALSLCCAEIKSVHSGRTVPVR
jgi:predicted dehydrogenase